MKFCFNLLRSIQRRCFSPAVMRELAALVDLKPEVPECPDAA